MRRTGEITRYAELKQRWATDPEWLRVKADVLERCGGNREAQIPGKCEAGCGVVDDPAHRWSAGRGGPTTATNVLGLCRRIHDLCHDTDAGTRRAYSLGWFVKTGHDPERVPVWLAIPWPGWFLLTQPDDGGKHLVVPLAEEDLVREFAECFTDPRTGEIRIPAPPRLPVPKPFGATRKGTTTHAQHH